MSLYGDDVVDLTPEYQDNDLEEQMIAEAIQAAIDDKTKQIPVKFESGYGMEQLVKDPLTHDRTRLIFIPF